MSMIRAATSVLLSMMVLVSQSAHAFYRIPLPGGGELRGESLKELIVDVSRLAIDPLGIWSRSGLLNPLDLGAAILKDPNTAFEFVKNPENLPHVFTANAIISARNSVRINGHHAIPPSVKEALTRLTLFDPAMLNSVRWSANWDLTKNTLPTIAFFKARAIALIDTVVFKYPEDVENVALWAHELQHVLQYQRLGVANFAREWSTDPTETGAIEKEAYAKEKEVSDAISNFRLPPRGIVPVESFAQCTKPLVAPGVINKSMIYCDLYAGRIPFVGAPPGQTIFEVRANAEAKAVNRNRTGKMALIMTIVNKNNKTSQCNRTQNEIDVPGHAPTKLEAWQGFYCEPTMNPGETLRIVIMAPNRDAVALSTGATAHVKGKPRN